MKRLVLLLLATFIMIAVPVLAEQAPKNQKDECLLYSRDCVAQADSLTQKIKKLQNEINKGTKVYSPEELKRLNGKLKEAEDLVDMLLYAH